MGAKVQVFAVELYDRLGPDGEIAVGLYNGESFVATTDGMSDNRLYVDANVRDSLGLFKGIFGEYGVEEDCFNLSVYEDFEECDDIKHAFGVALSSNGPILEFEVSN